MNHISRTLGFALIVAVLVNASAVVTTLICIADGHNLSTESLAFTGLSATVLLSLIGACIAYQQHLVNVDRLRLELFEKRFDVYELVQRFFDLTVQSGEVTSESRSAISEAKFRARLLFGKDVNNYITELRKEANVQSDAQSTLSHQSLDPDDPKYREAVDRKYEVIKSREEHLDKMSELFRCYMDFGDIQLKDRRWTS